MATEVIQDIKTPTIEHWTVPGTILSNLNLKHPKYGTAGAYIYRFEYSIQPTGGVVLTLISTILLPKWSSYNDAYTSQKEEWDRFIRSLEKHEVTHHSIAVNEFKALSGKVELLAEASSVELDKLFHDAKISVESKTEAYDLQTDHGVSEGAVLDQSVGLGSGGGGGCFASETLVLLSDGTRKPIVDICLRDELVFLDLDTMNVVSMRPDRISRHVVREIIEVSSGDRLCFTASLDQDIISASGPVSTRWLLDTAELVTIDAAKRELSGRSTRVSKIVRRVEKIEVVSISTKKPMGFIVGEDNFVGRCSGTDTDIPKR